jgi:hypothetical protein
MKNVKSGTRTRVRQPEGCMQSAVRETGLGLQSSIKILLTDFMEGNYGINANLIVDLM